MKAKDRRRLSPAEVAISQMDFTGNIIPHDWYEHIRHDSKKPNLPAIIILSDIVYWYRAAEVTKGNRVVGHQSKFDADKLQKSRAHYAEQFGLTKKQVSDAIEFLVKKGLITQELRTFTTDAGTTMRNVMYLEPVPEKIAEITYGSLRDQSDDSDGDLQSIPSDPSPKVSPTGDTSIASGPKVSPTGETVQPTGETNTKTTTEITLTTSPTGGAEAPIPEQLSMKDQFYQMLKELEDTPANKRVAKLMGIYVHCYGDKNLPDYGKLGAVAKKIGSAGRLAELLWLNTTKQITGDVLDYIMACERNRKKGNRNGNGRKKSTTGANTDAGQGYTQPASATPADEAARIRTALGITSPLASD